jgi:hypothetical protein
MKIDYPNPIHGNAKSAKKKGLLSEFKPPPVSRCINSATAEGRADGIEFHK